MSYSFLDQSITASCLIQPHDIDSFYSPIYNLHNGFAFDGNYYLNGVLQIGHPPASWFSEPFGPYRSDIPQFPTYGLILLSSASMVILDESVPTIDPSHLTLWMQFLLSDNFALANNWNGALNGWTPNGLAYADGIISIMYSPDIGNQPSLISTLSNVQIASNTLTVTCNNNFDAGDVVTFSGVAIAAFLNGVIVTITTASSTQFTANYTYSGTYTPTNDFGTVMQSPLSITSNMVVSVDFSQDKIYLDVAV